MLSAARGASQVITITMSTVINARPGRVWRALTQPRELVRWDERIVEPIDVPADYPKEGQHARWRSRSGGVQVVIHDRPQQVVPGTRLHSSVAVGLFRFEATYTLHIEAGEPGKTRLGLKLVANNAMPMMGGELDRFAVRRMAVEHVDTSLRSVQKWCENET